MSTAIAEPDQLVSAPEDVVLFMSRRSDLRLVKRPRYPQFGQSGEPVGETKGEAVQFRDGTLRLPKTGTVALEDGRSIDAQELRAWLEGHRFFEDREDGFWRVDPTAPAVSREELDALLEIVQSFDSARLEAFIEQERNGWAREDLLSTAETALERLAELEAATAADQGGQG